VTGNPPDPPDGGDQAPAGPAEGEVPPDPAEHLTGEVTGPAEQMARPDADTDEGVAEVVEEAAGRPAVGDTDTDEGVAEVVEEAAGRPAVGDTDTDDGVAKVLEEAAGRPVVGDTDTDEGVAGALEEAAGRPAVGDTDTDEGTAGALEEAAAQGAVADADGETDPAEDEPADEEATEEPGGEAEPGGDGDGDEAEHEDEQTDALAGFAAEMADLVGGSGWTAEHGTVKVRIGRDRWHAAVATASGRLPFFGWLSAVDWAREVQVGEPAEAPDELEERYEVLCRLSSVTDASAMVISTDVPKDDPWMPSIIDVFPGAGWHERETAEMFGLDFRGNPNKNHLYLPDSFEGHPLRKDFPLLSREVKPWPGTVDVEGMPGTENVEAGDGEADEAAAEDEA
jgi:NADH-quinone oxidoreductase subunit C